MPFASIFFAIAVFVVIAALFTYVMWAARNEPLGKTHLDVNVDLRHYRADPPFRGGPLAVVFAVLALIAVTSWASNQDRLAKAEERQASAAPVPPKPALKITITRNQIVEAESENCWAVANTRKGTTYNSCAD